MDGDAIIGATLADPWMYIAIIVIAILGLWLRAVAVGGKWYSAAQVEREMKAADDAVERAEHDRDEWRTESRIKDQQLMEKDEQLRHLAEVGELQKSMLTEVRAIARTRGGSEVPQ